MNEPTRNPRPAPIDAPIEHRPIQSALKRVIDLAGAAILLTLTIPLLLATALAIAVSMGRPTIFRQARPGRHECPFTMLKFRTMTDEADRQGVPLPDGRRLTRLGRFLRRSSLDELPTLWNVLRGEMSLVGPRPLLTRYLPSYTARERLRSRMRPGITGWAQVNGRNRASWTRRLALDVWYVEHWSLWLDARILLATAGAVLGGRDVVLDPHSEMRDLDEERPRALIRLAAVRDADEIVAILRAGFDPRLLSTTIYSCDGVGNYVKDQIAAQGDTLYTLLELEGRLVACAETRVRQDEVFLGYLAVASAARRAGLGSRVLAASIGRPEFASCRTMRLDVFASNSVALGWYERLGFEIEQETPIWSLNLPSFELAPGEIELRDWQESEASQTRYGFSNFRLLRRDSAWTVGRLGQRWFRIQDPALLRDRAALATLRSIDSERSLLAFAPEDSFSLDLFEDPRRVAVSCRMQADLATVLARLG